MTTTYIDIPEWFNTKDYDIYKTFSSKEICVEIEIRRFQIQFLKKGINLSNRDKDILKHEIPNISNEEIHSNLLEKILALTRENFYFNSYNYNKAQSDIYYTVLKFILSEDSNIIKQVNSVDNLELKDIHNYYMVPRDIVFIYELYKFSNCIEDFVDINLEELNRITKEYYEERKNEFTVFINEKDTYIDDVLINSDNGYSDYLNYRYSENLLPSSDDFTLNSIRLFKETEYFTMIPTIPLSELHLKVNINAPNETIIEQVISMVENKREMNNSELIDINQSTTKNKKNGGYRIITTLIEQKIIQYLDLYIWNLEKKQKPTSDWYMEILYKKEKAKKQIIAHSKMNDTIKPNAKKWLNKKWLYSMYHFDIPSYNDIKSNN